MLVAACPNCGAEIRFRSTALPVKVCDFCRSAVVRRDLSLEAIGKIAEVPEDISPLRVGAAGFDGPLGFVLVGRTRWRWAGGGWSEWLMLYEDGGHGWLAEAMGRFMLLHEVRDGRHTKAGSLAAAGGLALRQTVSISDIELRVVDIKTATCVGAEGELPFAAPGRLVVANVDLMSDDGHCASIQTVDGEASVYLGRFVTLEALKPSRLRALQGWRAPAFAS